MEVEVVHWLGIAARVLLGGVFVSGGLRHLCSLREVVATMRARRVPSPRVVLLGISAFQIVAGSLLMAGMWLPYASAGLIVFTLFASLLMLDFWHLHGEARENAINAWQANAGIVGGLLLVLVQSAG